MKQITYDEAIELIAKYSKGLSDDKEIDPKKDQFTIVLPLEHHQMIIVRLVLIPKLVWIHLLTVQCVEGSYKNE